MIRAEVQTARLRLRPVAAQDETAVLEGLKNLAVSSWLAVVPYPYGPTDFQVFLTEIAQPGATFAIEDGTGCVGIMGLEKPGAGAIAGLGALKLGYWLTPRAHGQGYATEAARAVLTLHFAQGGGPVVSGYFEGNAPSANVLRKLGFVETGRGELHCRALNRSRPHVDLILTSASFHKASA
jgi:RimJ/RimL family protein N-acetyltransferase